MQLASETLGPVVGKSSVQDVSQDPVLLTLSIVSHGQGTLVGALLDDLAAITIKPIEIIVTLNIPEDETFLSDRTLPGLQIIRNRDRLGFGANHNQAFRKGLGSFFCVLNPDIRVDVDTLTQLLATLRNNNEAASCAPVILSPDGAIQDSARRYPTVVRLLGRLIGEKTRDYEPDMTTSVDWVAGMLVMFRREAFAQIGGFDERYFMYLEDADICRRLTRAGWLVLYEPTARAVHDARRASHHDLRHLRWHLRSALRFLFKI